MSGNQNAIMAKMYTASEEQFPTAGTVLKRWLYGILDAIAPFLTKKDKAVYGVVMRRKIGVRFSMCTLFLLGCYGVLFWHIFSLQIRNRGKFSGRNYGVASGVQSAARGRIFDNRGMTLYACDLSTRDICVEPRYFAKGKEMEILSIVCNALGLEREEVWKKWQRAKNEENCALVAKDIPWDDPRLNDAREIAGVEIAPEPGNPRKVRVCFYPRRVEKKGRNYQGAMTQLSRIFNVNLKNLRTDSLRAYNWVRNIVLKRNVPWDVADNLQRTLRQKKLARGFVFSDSWVRNYPHRQVGANLLGYLNDRREGVSGIEALMDEVLQPRTGKFVFKHDKFGRPIDDGIVWTQKPREGADVYLSINSRLQQIAEEELAQLWEKFAPERAYAIMADPKTGAILALAQYPHFNPNDKDDMREIYRTVNHCLVQAYEPGSIMKGISLMGVLEHKIATLDTEVDCENGRWYYNRSLLTDSHRSGVLTLAEVVEQSSNIGTAKFSLMLGDERVYQNMSGYGFGRPTGLGFYPDSGKPMIFRHEARGRFKDLHNWDSLTVTRMPMGQGLSLTPLQIVQAWMALANHGVMMQPFVVDKVKWADGTSQVNIPYAKSITASPDTVAQLVKALVRVTEGDHGTGKRAAIPGYHVAGKTGTAQFWVPADKEKGIKGHYSTTDYLASFVGFVPAENPAFVLLVSAARPSKVYHTGSGVAAPVFRKIAERSLDYLQIPPDLPAEREAYNKRMAKK